MGASLSCFHSSGSDEKPVKGNRPDDYTEINDDFLTPDRPAVSENGGAKADGNVEELYENSSSIIRASHLERHEVEDKSPLKQTSAGRAAPQPLADLMKLNAIPTTNGKKAAANPQLASRAEKQERDKNTTNGSKGVHHTDQAPTFRPSNPSEIGHYQNVQPVGVKKDKPLPIPANRECEVVGDLYAKVQKPKTKISNGSSEQLNYVEVEFLQSPDGEDKIVIDSKNDNPSTTYTDVIHKDGKIMLVTPSS